MTHNYVLLIYGEGGHCAQMNRLVDKIADQNIKFIHVVDSKRLLKNQDYYYSRPLRKKDSSNIAYMLISILFSFLLALRILVKYKPTAIISTGPAICFVFFLLSKPLRVKTIFIETWSRFYSKSFTAKIIYPISDYFYYQNIELKCFYPKGKYSGRL